MPVLFVRYHFLFFFKIHTSNYYFVYTKEGRFLRSILFYFIKQLFKIRYIFFPSAVGFFFEFPHNLCSFMVRRHYLPFNLFFCNPNPPILPLPAVDYFIRLLFVYYLQNSLILLRRFPLLLLTHALSPLFWEP